MEKKFRKKMDGRHNMDKINEFLARLTELIREIEELLEIVDRLALSLNLENLRRLLEDPKQK